MKDKVGYRYILTGVCTAVSTVTITKAFLPGVTTTSMYNTFVRTMT